MRQAQMGLPWLISLAFWNLATACMDSTSVTWNVSSYTLADALPQLCSGGVVNLVGSSWGSYATHCNISVTKSVTFQSPDGQPVMFQCAAVPVFWVTGGGNLTLRGLMFVNGTTSIVQASSGGLGRLEIQGCSTEGYSQQCAIQVTSTVVVSHSTFDRNTNGALCITGTLDASNNTFSNNVALDGAAVALIGHGSLQQCDFLENRASSGSGGAVSHRPTTTSTLNITTCLFQSNTASVSGGAVYSSSLVSATNVQFDQNAAPTAGAVSAASATIKGCTFTSNLAQAQGGALCASGAVSISGSEFTNNSAVSAPGDGGAVWAGDIFAISASRFVRNVASSVGTGGAVYTQSAAMSNAVLGSSFVQNSAAFAGALGLNAGCLLQDTSFVSNTATWNGGAVLMTGTGTLHVSSVTAAHNNAALGGAIYAPQAQASIATSAFTANYATTTASQMATVLAGLSALPRPYTYNSSQLDAGGFGGAVFVAGGEISNSQFVSNVATVAGGAILGSTVSVYDATFSSNAASTGGAVYAGTAFSCSGSSFTANAAELLGGGAVAGLNTTVSLYRCDFLQNGAREWGGALFTTFPVEVQYGNFIGNNGSTGGALYSAASCSLQGTTFQANRALGATGTDGLGGALNCNVSVSTQSCTFNANAASKDGGAVSSQRIISESDAFSGNAAQGSGGACRTGNASFYLSTFTSNSAGGDGGAIVATGNLMAAGNAFQSNRCLQRGGAVAVVAAPTLISAQFTSNSAVKGGAIFAGGSGYTLTLQGIQFTSNTAVAGAYSATPMGGAVLAAVPVVINRGSFQQNRAAKAGGAVYGLRDINASDSLFTGNWAGGSGGAIFGEYPSNTAIFLTSTLFITNQANASDGGAVQGGGAVRATATTFQGNTAGGNGGAVQAPFGPAWAIGCDFSANLALNGGAVSSAVEVQTWQSNFTDNLATASGGAIWAGNKLWVHPGSVFMADQAGNFGGALYADSQAAVTVENTTLSANVAKFGGGLFAGSGANTTVLGSALVDNEALQRGPAVYSLGWLSVRTSTFSGNTCPLDAYGYLNTWFQPTDRRSLTSLTIHWLVYPTQQVGNQLEVELPKEVQLNRCTLGEPSGTCVTQVSIDGFLPSTSFNSTIDADANTVTLLWSGVLNITHRDVYTLQLTNLLTPNHCDALTYTVSTRHCVQRDLLSAGKVIFNDCVQSAGDYTHTTSFQTSEPTGTPKGCSVCNACYLAEWQGLWRCHSDAARGFTRAALEGSCSAST